MFNSLLAEWQIIVTFAHEKSFNIKIISNETYIVTLGCRNG